MKLCESFLFATNAPLAGVMVISQVSSTSALNALPSATPFDGISNFQAMGAWWPKYRR